MQQLSRKAFISRMVRNLSFAKLPVLAQYSRNALLVAPNVLSFDDAAGAFCFFYVLWAPIEGFCNLFKHICNRQTIPIGLQSVTLQG